MGSQTWNEANSLFWIKHYRDKVAAFESGEIYVRIRKEHREELAFQDRIIRGLKLDLPMPGLRTVELYVIGCR